MTIKQGIIYICTNKVNKKTYIGQTRNGLKKRKRNHLISKDDLYFHRAIRKYGVDNFEWDVLVECPIEDLNDQEAYWITYWES